MDKVTAEAIALIEATYDLDAEEPEWLDRLVSAGAKTFDHGLGFSLDQYEVVRCPGGSEVRIHDVRTRALPEDHLERVRSAVSGLPPHMVAAINPPGFAGTWTEITRDYPAESKRVLEALGFSDMLGIMAADPKGIGIRVMAPLPEVTHIRPRARTRWKMLGAHIASAYRLRRALASGGEIELRKNGYADRAEAVLDPTKFRIVDAYGAAQHAKAGEMLRRAARRVDRSRSTLRTADPAKALETWDALVSGRWSLVDWFDTDQRRFILAVPNPPNVWDPRGLTEQEAQVATFAALGDANKVIGYRLGLSQSRVSTLLRSAMQKLGAKNRAQLATWLKTVASPDEVDASVA